MQTDRPLSETLTVMGIGALLLWVYTRIYLPLMPNENGFMGHDWSIVFPAFLNGYYWALENGPFSIPWFTAAKCGGYAFFATEGFYSLGSVLTWFISPIKAVQTTLLLFVSLSLLSFYHLMRAGLKASPTASMIAAMLFMFNGFSSHRMIVGHYAFHGFLLVPLIATLAISASRKPPIFLAQAALIGLAFAYMVHAPMLQILPASLLSVIALILFSYLKGDRGSRPWLLLGFGGMLGIAIAASKLVAFTSLMSQFPRTYYPLPGIDKVSTLLSSAFTALFLHVPNDIGKGIVNSAFSIDRHEWEFGVSPIPLVLIPIGFLVHCAGKAPNHARSHRTSKRHVTSGGIAVIAAVPFLLNWYEPLWNQFLKEIPYISSSSNLVRWFIIEIPILCCMSGLAVDPILSGISQRHRASASTGLIILVGLALVIYLIHDDLRFYNQGYSSRPIETAWEKAHETKSPVPISQIAFRVDGNGPNDGLIIGASTILCYEPTMGYGLEKFPAAPLFQGPVFPPDGPLLNLKNPACYTYPVENQCHPGNHFTASQKTAGEALTHYKPFSFAFSVKQRIANSVSIMALIFALGALTFAVKIKISTWSKISG